MNPLVPFVIPIRGLFPGQHDYTFDIDASFFKQFEHSPIQDGEVKVELLLVKQPDMYVLQFDFEGTVKTDCDRCLVPINLPIFGEEQLLVKFSLEETSEEADVIFISPETPKLSVAKYIYEFICLSVPIIKTYDCQADEPPPCDEGMLTYLDKEESQDEPGNSVWDELKKLKGDN